MADPNTQIDWWIAQTWQEAQGGADNDALVAWLNENGLTAVSSFTIMQAALSCPPETAKEIVYSHPAWAGAEQNPDVDSLNYTTDTLEPEPEPDPTFELDDWAEQIEEEAPVYGEEGFQPDPDAGASPASYTRDSQTPTAVRGALLLDPAPSDAGEPAPANDETSAFDDPDGFEDDAPESDSVSGMDIVENGHAEQFAEAASAVPAPTPKEASDKPADPSEASSDAEFVENSSDSGEPALADSKPVAAADLSVPETVDTAPTQPDPEPPQPAVAAVPMPPPLVYQPLPEIQIVPPVAPAAPLFALPQRDRRPAPPLFPPVNDTDQAVATNGSEPMPVPEVDPAPLADAPDEPPEPAMAPNGLDHSADSDLTIPVEEPETPPTATVEDTNALRSGMQAMMKPDEAGPQDETMASPDEEGGEPAQTDLEPELPPRDEAEEPESPAPAAMDSTGDLPPGMLEAMEQTEAEPQDEMAEEPDEETGELAPTDWEQELPPLEEEEEEETEEFDSNASSLMADPEDDERDGAEEDEDAAPRPRKQVLLDRSDEMAEGGLPGDDPDDIPLGDTPAELAAAARKLGIDFREGDKSDAGVDPEMTKAAKDLGISFREGAETDGPVDDEATIEAQKLGISFREGETTSDKPKKPVLVKYLPIILAVTTLFFLLLIGATFAGPIIGWLRS